MGNPAGYKGKWHELFNNLHPIYAEFGCGRGQFSMRMASMHPERNYIAFESRGCIIIRALEKATDANLNNIIFVNEKRY
jgi:tRNA (guanine-N7-)-methyltransferase